MSQSVKYVKYVKYVEYAAYNVQNAIIHGAWIELNPRIVFNLSILQTIGQVNGQRIILYHRICICNPGNKKL